MQQLFQQHFFQIFSDLNRNFQLYPRRTATSLELVNLPEFLELVLEMLLLSELLLLDELLVPDENLVADPPVLPETPLIALRGEDLVPKPEELEENLEPEDDPEVISLDTEPDEPELILDVAGIPPWKQPAHNRPSPTF